MRQEEGVLTWSAVLVLLAMLLTVATVGTHKYRAATRFGLGGGALSDRWAIDYPAARVTSPAGPAARHVAPTPVPSGPRAATGNSPQGRSQGLILLMLLGQGARPTIGLR